MQKMFLAMLAAALLWGTAAKADQKVTIGGTGFDSCATAQKYVDADDPEFQKQCGGAQASSDPRAAGAYAAAPQSKMSEAELAQLNSLQARRAEELLGTRPANSIGFIGQKATHTGLPSGDGCTERRVPDYQARQWVVRVVCTTGRHRNQ